MDTQNNNDEIMKKMMNKNSCKEVDGKDMQKFMSHYYGHISRQATSLSTSPNGTKHDVSFSPGYVSPRTFNRAGVVTRDELLRQHRAQRKEDNNDDEGTNMNGVEYVNVNSSPKMKMEKRSYQSLSTGTLESVISSKILLNGDEEEKREYEEVHVKEEKAKITATTSLDEDTPLFISLMYGMINCAIVVPVIMSFGSIIYRDAAFQPYLPTLIKLTTISGFVHQLCFSTFSSLPFAVGQVQDAGLIFLSKMASDIVTHCRRYGYSDDHILATTTIGLSLCTAVLGLSLLLIGRCGLASIVQKLPVPVVGGYLAFIGFFCGQSGMALMAGIDVENLSDWSHFFTSHRMTLMAPGIISGLAIYFLARSVRHMAVLPICIMSLIVIFYAILPITGMSLDEARDNGWFVQANDPPVWYKTWHFLRPSLVVWSALPQLTFTLISMICVVALSSSLDVAAIELEMGRPLNYDHEITTVGWSNVISGLTGGYTGSYIFSQSIFSLRAGIRSRACGYFIAFIELIIVVLPFPVTSYLPNFFFGSLLVMICVDLMYEWLWDVRNKTTTPEYCISLSTFALIQIVGVEYGILLGLVLFFVGYKMGYDVGIVDDTYLKETEEKVLLPLRNSVHSVLNFLVSDSPTGSVADERESLLSKPPVTTPSLASTDVLNRDHEHDESLII